MNWRVCAHRPDAQLFPPTLVRGARATAPLGLRALARETRFGLLRRFFCRAPRGDPRETAKTGKFPAPTYIQCPKVPADRQFTLLWPHRIYIPSSCTRTTRTPSMLTMYEWLAVALTVRYLTAAFNTAVFCRLLKYVYLCVLNKPCNRGTTPSEPHRPREHACSVLRQGVSAGRRRCVTPVRRRLCWQQCFPQDDQ